jgi:hypothetical protein
MEGIIYHLIIDFIEDNYGTGEALDPCYNIEALAKYIADNLKEVK